MARKLSFKQWDVFAGGTCAAPGKNSYSIRVPGGSGPNGQVHFSISPISNSHGFHKGYLLQAFGLPGEFGWRWISPDGSTNGNGIARLFSTPMEAARVAQQVYQDQVGTERGNA